jgi:hypothetical protein
MTNKQANDSHTDCRADEGIAVQLIDTIINSLRILKRNYIEFIEDSSVKEALNDISDDEDMMWFLKLITKDNITGDDKANDSEDIQNSASTGTTQPTYIDDSGKVFTAADIIQGYKPKGSYKGHSISDKVNSKEFGKVK